MNWEMGSPRRSSSLTWLENSTRQRWPQLSARCRGIAWPDRSAVWTSVPTSAIVVAADRACVASLPSGATAAKAAVATSSRLDTAPAWCDMSVARMVAITPFRMMIWESSGRWSRSLVEVSSSWVLALWCLSRTESKP